MRKIILIGLCYCYYSYGCIAQESKSKIYSFHSINSLALVNGSNAISGALQTVNGFSKGSWFAGIGLGLDYYQYRSIPVFADIRYEIGKKRNKFFLYGDVGINFEWTQDNFYHKPTLWNANSSNQFTNGFYSDAGIGLNATGKNGNAFVLSLGYSGKTMKEIIYYVDGWTGNDTKKENYFRFNRLIIKAGFRF